MEDYAPLDEGQEAHWEVVERILFLYAKLNPGKLDHYITSNLKVCTKQNRDKILVIFSEGSRRKLDWIIKHVLRDHYVWSSHIR